MRAPSQRVRRLTALAVAPAAVLVAGGLVWHSSTAAFTATTRNAGNEWSTGTVVLTDDDEGRAAFNVRNLVPGSTGERCIVVTSGANVPGEVRSYVQNLSGSAQGLEEHIDLQVELGSGGSFESCDGFTPDGEDLAIMSLADLAQANYDYETGAAPWSTTGTPGESVTYRGTWTFDTDGMTQSEVDALQGAQVSIDLVWELRTDDDPTNT